MIYLSFIEQVTLEQLQQARENFITLLAELTAGFRLVSDLSRLDSISIDCAREIGSIMELCEQHGIALVVRVIPDPAKDIELALQVLRKRIDEFGVSEPLIQKVGKDRIVVELPPEGEAWLAVRDRLRRAAHA